MRCGWKFGALGILSQPQRTLESEDLWVELILEYVYIHLYHDVNALVTLRSYGRVSANAWLHCSENSTEMATPIGRRIKGVVIHCQGRAIRWQPWRRGSIELVGTNILYFSLFHFTTRWRNFKCFETLRRVRFEKLRLESPTEFSLLVTFAPSQIAVISISLGIWTPFILSFNWHPHNIGDCCK